MKATIKHELSRIKPHMPGDDQFSIMHGIYKRLQDQGYTCHEAKRLIDEVILDNLVNLERKLVNQLEQVKESIKKLNKD
ncbi:MAG: hypothetical protein H6755_07000 [Candidatus Omnitrophica bacterium]|nr:hypothetical protein [Candidatus Omnitrophota bacterium]MCB9748138.1 hypothetical protein [Candidatus Omnitrophota bacterium]